MTSNDSDTNFIQSYRRDCLLCIFLKAESKLHFIINAILCMWAAAY